jgi:outer membrane receptor protein involved in Fe transport
MFNLMAQVKIRPIKPLEIGVSYHLRTNRSKVLVVNYLALQNINNLSAKASYAINSQWSAFVNVDNILNQKWYLGPSMPSQGIVAMLGGSFKF